MEWIINNWGFIAGVGSILAINVSIIAQTKHNAKEIKRIEEEMKSNKSDNDKVISKLFDEIKHLSENMTDQMQIGFNSINDKLFGLVKDGIFSSNKRGTR